MNLENLENRPFLQKVRENSRTCSYVREKSVTANYSVHISFSLTISMVVRKVLILFLVSKCEFRHFA